MRSLSRELALPIKVFEIEVRQTLDVQGLDALTDAEADAAGDEGFLRGNGRYEDHRGWTWRDVRAALEVEGPLLAQLAETDDSAATEAAFEAARDPEDEGAAVLWGLDIGVASAVIALSAMGAMPFISCNAGSFGGIHAASRPYIALYLAAAAPEAILALARRAGVGLEVEDGVVRLYARSALDLLQFACFAEETHRGM